jgi:FkbM family methyltransferase
MMISNASIPLYHKLGSKWLLANQPFLMGINGSQMQVRPRSSDVYVIAEVFCEQVYTPVSTLDLDPVNIADLGANIGAFTVWAAQRWKDARIVAVEMEGENFRMLQHNVTLNLLDARVSTLQAAIWHSKGAVAIQRHPLNSGMHKAIGYREGDKVPAITLDELLKTQKLAKIDLLKMDIEGAEAGVFTESQVTTLSEKVGYIVAEMHPKVPLAEAIGVIEKAGFDVQARRQSFRRTVMVHAVNQRFHRVASNQPAADRCADANLASFGS